MASKYEEFLEGLSDEERTEMIEIARQLEVVWHPDGYTLPAPPRYSWEDTGLSHETWLDIRRQVRTAQMRYYRRGKGPDHMIMDALKYSNKILASRKKRKTNKYLRRALVLECGGQLWW